MNKLNLTSAIYIILLHNEINQWQNLKTILNELRTKLILLGYELNHISNESLYDLLLTAVEMKSYFKVKMVQSDLLLESKP
ncbi:MAG: hypothetical protein J0M15_12800 [Deltaproteobacteria bacterium]|nr:hypothetical protein [Deltaproteobacteria bacterium]